MKNVNFWVVSVLLAGLLAGTRLCRGGELGPGWRYRRALRVNLLPTSAPGGNLAWAQFYTNSARLPDGRDLRVTTASGLVLPMRLLRVSAKDDLVRLAFAEPTAGEYFVWWGNAHPGTAPPQLQIQRGVFLRVYPLANGPRGNWRQMLRLFDGAKPSASLFVPEMFMGYDPTGWNRHDMMLYRTELHITSAGNYTFAFDVAEAGFLNLDGKNLLTKTQPGGMTGRVRFKRTIYLKPGWYPMTVVELHLWWLAGVAVDWKPPGAARYAPIPAAAFAPANQAVVGRLENVGRGYAADFSIKPQAQLFVPPDNYIQRYTFAVRVPATFAPRVDWTFSDGQTAQGLRVEHEFLAPGRYTVGVTIHQAGNIFTARRRLLIRTEMFAKFPYPPVDPSGVVADIIDNYNLKALSGEQLYRGIMFFHHYRNLRGLTAWGLAWALSPDAQNAKAVLPTARLLVRRALERGNFRQAGNIFLLAARKHTDVLTQSRLLANYAMTACNYTATAPAVLHTLQRWARNHANLAPAAAHVLNTALAYAAVATGDGALAAKYVKAAGDAAPMAYSAQEIRQGVLARNVESYISSHHYRTADDLLEQWEMQFPRAIIKGYTRLLRVELMVAQQRFIYAAQIAVQYVNSEPKSFYAAELLYRAGMAYQSAGKTNRAELLRAELKNNYPESPYAYKKYVGF
ncbi:MAG: PKD domain-containing protein [Phycisphaerae bacterium]